MITEDITLEPIEHRAVLETGYEDPGPEQATLPAPDLTRIPPVADLMVLLDRAAQTQIGGGACAR